MRRRTAGIFASLSVLLTALAVGPAAQAVLAAPARSLASATPAAPAAPHIAASFVPLPAGAPASTSIYLASISCGGPGFCVAVGTYVDKLGSFRGLIETWSGGKWSASTAPLPHDATASQQVGMGGVACAGVGSCAAYGQYNVAGGDAAMLLTLGKGTWTAVAVPALAQAPGTFPRLTGVGCNAPGNCTVVGNYQGTDFLQRGLVAMFNGTAWKVETAPVPGDAISPDTEALSQVSCASKLCIGVGHYRISDGTDRALAEAITPGKGTANGTQPPVPSGANSFVHLDAISCVAAGPCAATGGYTVNTTSHALVEPLGGAGFAPQPPPTPTAPNPGSIPVLAAITCGTATFCLLSGDYARGNSTTVFIDQLSGGHWATVKSPSRHVMAALSCGSTSFCVGAALAQGAVFNASDSLTVLDAGKWYAFAPLDPAGRDVPPSLTGTACDAPADCVVIGVTSDSSSRGVIEHVTAGAADHTPPAVTLTGPAKPVILATSATVSWTAKDTGSGVAAIQLRHRSSAWSAGFTPWSAATSLPASATHAAVSGLKRGTDYCYSVRAADHAGNWSAWTAQRCVAVPLDDRALAADKHWTRASGSAYWNGTATVSATKNAVLTLAKAQLDRITLVATRCPSCGLVGVYVGGTLIAKVNLAAKATANRVLITLPAFSLRSGTVTLKVLSAGLSVRVDGLAVIRSLPVADGSSYSPRVAPGSRIVMGCVPGTPGISDGAGSSF
jgi:hypothetical protein